MGKEDDLHERARSYLLTGTEVRRQMIDRCSDAIVAAAEAVVRSLRSGGKVLLCGNGGSAADCQHMAAEMTSGLQHVVQRPGLAAVALTTDTSFLTAYANDYGFAGVFERQVLALGKPGDVLIGISTSGNSESVIRGVQAAKAAKIYTIALTGAEGKLAHAADLVIAVPSTFTPHIQEAHLAIEHAVCDLVEYRLFGEPVALPNPS